MRSYTQLTQGERSQNYRLNNAEYSGHSRSAPQGRTYYSKQLQLTLRFEITPPKQPFNRRNLYCHEWWQTTKSRKSNQILYRVKC